MDVVRSARGKRLVGVGGGTNIKTWELRNMHRSNEGGEKERRLLKYGNTKGVGNGKTDNAEAEEKMA